MSDARRATNRERHPDQKDDLSMRSRGLARNGRTQSSLHLSIAAPVLTIVFRNMIQSLYQ
jgi:hypothetical protein